jgi:thymidine phosphorylase
MGAETSMLLTVRPLAIDTFRENTILLSRDCRALRPERLAGVRKVEVSASGRTMMAEVVICDDPALVGPDEAGLTEPAFRRLGAPAGSEVRITPAPPPRGAAALRAKIAGATLTDAQIDEVVHDLADHRWSDIEISAFLVACASFMSAEETLALTRAMAGAGRRLAWNRPLVADKHCIGGVPGNRTSLIVAPVAAAHGLITPKTSSRAITSPAGTADTMEVLARVDLDEEEMRAVVERCGGCIVWGGRVNLSPVDDVLISVERPLSLDTPEQMVASILSKKLAAGSTHLLLDLPSGPGSKMREPGSALRLRKLFEFVADRVGLTVDIFGMFAVFERPTGLFIGETGVADFHRGLGENFDGVGEAAWVFTSKSQRRGFAYEAAMAALNWYSSCADRRRTVCLIAPDNRPSLVLAERLGYVPFGNVVYRGGPFVKLERTLID